MLSTSQNDLTGEHSCIMLKRLTDSDEDTNDNWLQAYMTGKYFDAVMGGEFFPEIQRSYLYSLGLAILGNFV